MADEPEADVADESGAPSVSRGVIAALLGGVMVVILVAWTVAAGGGEPDDTADRSPNRETAARRTSTSESVSPTTTLAPTTTTATAATVPPTTTAGRSSTSATSLVMAPPPPPSPNVTQTLPPDPRPKALDSSASCSLQTDGSILATASVKWSDGFTDTGTATFTTHGRNVLRTAHRNWVFDFYVIAPPGGAIGNLACQAPDGGSGALYWDG